jgi:hypothetical protein
VIPAVRPSRPHRRVTQLARASALNIDEYRVLPLGEPNQDHDIDQVKNLSMIDRVTSIVTGGVPGAV